jgi:Biotin-lipoyl like
MTDNIELRSPEIQEVLGQPPSWLLRWGLTIFFFALLWVLAIGWLIHYPTIVNVDFILTSQYAPKPIMVKLDGRLEKLMVKEGDWVASGDIVGYMESTALHDEVLQLEQLLSQFDSFTLHDDYTHIDKIHLESFNHLGELHTYLQNWYDRYG